MRLKVGAKLVSSFIVILLVTGIIGMMGISQTEKMFKAAEDIGRNQMEKTRILGELEGIKSDYRIWVVQYVFAVHRKDLKAAADYELKINETTKAFNDLVPTLQPLLQTDEGKQKTAKVESAWNELLDTDREVIRLTKAGQVTQAVSLLQGESKETYLYCTSVIDEFVKFNTKRVHEIIAVSQLNYKSGRQTTIVIILASLFAGLAGAIYIARGISRPTELLAGAALRMAKGDLTVDNVKVNTRDEIGEMSNAFNQMLINLKQMVRQINDTSQTVAATSQQLSGNSNEAASATQQVARAIEEVAKGSAESSRNIDQSVQVIEQVSQSIQQIASGAQQQSQNVIETTNLVNDMVTVIDKMAERMDIVKNAAEQNGKVAVNGGAAVDKTVQGMLEVKDAVFETAKKIHELGEQSQKIGEIIQVIDDIAEQTNLLALNAAIEAARAGEHGKGFAVVADEVRKLAERSGKATKEIAELINDIQRGTKTAVDSMQVGTRQVETGVQLAEQAGKSLEEIVSGVKTADEHVQSIMGLIQDVLNNSRMVSKAVNNVAAITEENSAATEEMSASTEQVNSSMQNIASISEETTASAEEVSASSEELTASIEEITASSDQLAKMAQDLQNLVGQFKL